MAYAIRRLEPHDYGGLTFFLSDGTSERNLYFNPNLCEQFAAAAGYPITEIDITNPPSALNQWIAGNIVALDAAESRRDKLAGVLELAESRINERLLSAIRIIDAYLVSHPEVTTKQARDVLRPRVLAVLNAIDALTQGLT